MSPNFLLIMADQLAAPALSMYGDKIVKAPAIDKLQMGSCLKMHIATCRCVAHPVSLRTGRLPFSIAMYDNASEFMASIPPLLTTCATWAIVLNLLARCISLVVIVARLS